MDEKLPTFFLILTEDEKKRFLSCSGRVISIDLHGLTPREARQLLRNLIVFFTGESFVIKAIHGYIHGIAIKESLLYDAPIHKRVTGCYQDLGNNGVTYITIHDSA